MRILVVGGAGYVGSTSVERLLEAGHEVVVYDNLTSGHRTAVPDGARLVVGEIADRLRLEHLLRDGIDTVLHCAARSLVGESMSDPGLKVPLASPTAASIILISFTITPTLKDELWLAYRRLILL